MSSTTDNEQRFAYLLSPEFQIVNTAGKPLTGGWIEVYIHGTRVKYYCFSDFDGTLHPFQIPLDSLGSNIVLASPTHAYDIYIYNKFGALVMSRYNVVPACNAADIVEDVVVIDSPDETLNVTCDGGSNWHLTVNTDLIATTEQLASVSGELHDEIVTVSGDLQDQINNKKDLQLPYVASGTVTKTITKIEQNENGEIEVTYSDIDLPPQVPNIDIISPSGTIDVSSSINPATNTKTFKIDIHKTKMDFFDGYCGKSHYEDRSSSSTSAFGLYVDQWDEYKYQGDFIANSWQDENNTTFKLNSGLYLITASIRYQMNNDYNKEEYIRIATGAYNGLENGTRYKDWSYEKELGDGTAESSIQVSFIRNVEDDDDYLYMNGNHDLYFYPYLPVGVNYAFIDHLQIVKLDSIAAAGGGSGPRYAPGYGIEIIDDIISVATGTVVTNNYFNTVVSSINNEINEINTTIQNVTGDITELSEAVTNIVGVTGDFATTDYVDAAVSGLENYSAGQYISIEDHVISVTGLQPEGDYATTEYVDNRIASAAGDVYEAGQYVSIENNVINVTGVQPAGDYATNEDLQIVSGAIPESQEVEFEELDLAQFAQASAVTVIQNQINNVTGDINNINEAVTNIIGATGDYATEEYVDEAIAAVTGQPFEQVNSDWLATSGVAEILNKPAVFQLIAGDNIDITPSGNDLVISSTGGGSLSQVNSDWLATSGVAEILNKPLEANIVAGQNISIVQEYDNVIISATGIPSLDGYATEQYVDDAIDAATGMIPEAQVNADWLATSGKAEILNKPQEEAVEFEEINLEDYALASAIPDVSNFVTQQDIDDSIAPVQSQIDTLAAATGDYLTEQVNSDWNATSGISEILNKPESEEVEFEEVNLADYALASAIPDISNLATKTEVQAVDIKVDAVSGKLPTTEEGQFTIHPNTEGGDVTVIYPTDVSPVSAFYDLNAQYDDALSNRTGPSTYYYVFKSPGYDNDTWSANTGDVIQLKVKEAIQGLGSIMGFYATNSSPASSSAPPINYPSSTPLVVGTGIVYTVEPGVYTTALGSNPAGSSYGKYITIMVNTASAGTYVDDILNKIEFTIGRPNTALGTTVNLDRYYLANTVITSTSGYTQCVVAKDTASKKQTVYLPNSMPSAWKPDITESFQYGSNYNSPSGVSYNTKHYRAYKYTSSPTRYQFAYCTDWDYANRIMTFIAYDNSGNAIEKWTLDYSNYSSNVWTTTAITPDMSDYATEVELQTVSGAVDAVSGAIPESEEVQFEELDLSIYALASAVPDQLVAGDYVSIANDIISVTGLDNSNTFFATVGSTSWQDVLDAYNAGKRIFAVTSGKSVLPLAEYYSSRFYFSSTVRRSGLSNTSPSYIAYTLYSDNDWVDRSGDLQANWNETNNSAASYIRNKPDLSVYAAVASVTAVETDVANLVAATGDYLTQQVNADWEANSGAAEILNKPVEYELVAGNNIEIIASGGNVIISASGGTGEVTEVELATVSGTLEAEIQSVSAAIPDTSIYATETDLQTVSAAIPESESVEFEELELSDYALASAIPDVSNINTAITNLVAATGDYLQDSDLNGYATEAYVDAAITGVTFEQVNSDWNATSGVAEILNKPSVVDVTVGNLIAGDNISITASGDDIVIAVSGKQDILTGITDVQVVQTLPASPVATILYLIPEA